MVLQSSNHHSRGRHISGLTPSITSPIPSRIKPSSAKSTSAARATSVIQAAKRRAKAAQNAGKSPIKCIVDTRRRNALPLPNSAPVLNAEISVFNVPVDVEMADGSAPAPTTTRVNLPRHLARPPYAGIKPDALKAVGVENTPLEYILEVLEHTALDMLYINSTVKTSPVPSKTALPKEIDIHLGEVTPNPPTHMLAVFARSTPGSSASTSSNKLTLYPSHNILLATHCANLPPLPSPSQPSSQSITVPVVPLGLPAPNAFPALHSFLYTKNAAHLYRVLLPALPPHPPVDPFAAPKTSAERIAGLIDQISTLPPRDITKHLLIVNGVWRNACALGVFDEKLWKTLDSTWMVLLSALGKATNTHPV